MIEIDSNTDRLYNIQWLNSVIYWIINYCKDWARTGVTSFDHQLIFMTSSITYNIVTHSGMSANIRESNHGSGVHVRSIMRSTMYQKAPFCSPEMAQ